jgi:hypothetical protein
MFRQLDLFDARMYLFSCWFNCNPEQMSMGPALTNVSFPWCTRSFFLLIDSICGLDYRIHFRIDCHMASSLYFVYIKYCFVNTPNRQTKKVQIQSIEFLIKMLYIFWITN